MGLSREIMDSISGAKFWLIEKGRASGAPPLGFSSTTITWWGHSSLSVLVMKCSARVYRLAILLLDCSKKFGSLVKTSAVRSERAADVSRFFCTSAWLGVRSSAYAQADIQTSAALSERAAYSYQYPGFRFAP